MIFDTHCHLNCSPLYEDVENVIKRANEVGVNKTLVIGYDKKTSVLALELAKKYDNCYAALGIFPCEVYGINDTDLEEIFENIDNPKVLAVGEIGLDYHWEKDEQNKQIQKDMFIKQIDIANKYNLPVSIHCRDAIQDCYDILKNHPVYKGGILHCYAGSKEMALEFIKLGYYIALGGTVTFTNAKNPKEVAAYVPLENLVIETDAPYLAPHPFRGQTNEPKFLTLVIEEIARIKTIDKQIVEDVLYKNSLKAFYINE